MDDKYNEKINLIFEMIAFSVVDGKLHHREYDFIKLITQELKIEKEQFKALFHQELPTHILKTEQERIAQFYRLALLMHADGVLHKNEVISIHQIAITMGLNPSACNRVLKAMEKSPSKMIDEDLILTVFREQMN